MGENQTLYAPMMLPGTYTVSAKYLPRTRDFEVAAHQTQDIHFPEVSFIGDTDISSFTTVLQLKTATGQTMKFNDPVDDPWGFRISSTAMNSIKGEATYSVFAYNPEDATEHYCLYSGTITVVPADDYIEGRTIYI